MRIISQELRAWEREEYSDLRDSDLEGVHCWYCGERLEAQSYSEVAEDVDGMLMWVPVCDNCDPPPPPPSPTPPPITPTPMTARLACPICSETLAPPRRHSCGEVAQVQVGVAAMAVMLATEAPVQSV